MNNIEDKIKKEFQQREIQPSNLAWDKLSEKLESKNQEQTKNKFIYYRVAAVLIGLLVGFIFFLNKKESKINTKIEIVSSEKEQTPSTNEIIKDEILQNNKNEVVFTNMEKLHNNKPTINLVKQKSLKNNSLIKKSINNKQLQMTNNFAVSVDNSVNKKEENSKSDKRIQSIKNTQIAMLSQKLEIALISTKNIIDEKVAKKHRVLMNSSDDDIDSMLASAIGEQQINNKELYIQSNKLKYAVENQLNRESKNRMYYLIKTGVDTVESIIVSNNNN